MYLSHTLVFLTHLTYPQLWPRVTPNYTQLQRREFWQLTVIKQHTMKGLSSILFCDVIPMLLGAEQSLTKSLLPNAYISSHFTPRCSLFNKVSSTGTGGIAIGVIWSTLKSSDIWLLLDRQYSWRDQCPSRHSGEGELRLRLGMKWWASKLWSN